MHCDAPRRPSTCIKYIGQVSPSRTHGPVLDLCCTNPSHFPTESRPGPLNMGRSARVSLFGCVFFTPVTKTSWWASPRIKGNPMLMVVGVVLLVEF